MFCRREFHTVNTGSIKNETTLTDNGYQLSSRRGMYKGKKIKKGNEHSSTIATIIWSSATPVVLPFCGCVCFFFFDLGQERWYNKKRNPWWSLTDWLVKPGNITCLHIFFSFPFLRLSHFFLVSFFFLILNHIFLLFLQICR